MSLIVLQMELWANYHIKSRVIKTNKSLDNEVILVKFGSNEFGLKATQMNIDTHHKAVPIMRATFFVKQQKSFQGAYHTVATISHPGYYHSQSSGNGSS